MQGKSPPLDDCFYLSYVIDPSQTLPSAYAKLPIPKDQKMCGVYVTWVKTPSCVCVQLIGESTTQCLEYLLEDITQFYNSKAGDAYRIKEPEIGQARLLCDLSGCGHVVM